MKKKNLLLTFLIAATFLLGGGAELMAQTTVTIATGNALQEQSPINTKNRYSFAEIIYLQEEIGLADNKTISEIQLHFDHSYPNEVSNGIVLYMMNVEKANFDNDKDWVSISSDKIVYNESIKFPLEDGWFTIKLSTPFEYDHTKNLLIAFNKTTNNGNSGYTNYDKFFSTTFSEDHKPTLVVNSPSTAYDPSNMTAQGSRALARPHIKITFDDGDSCITPKDLSATPTSTTADVTWTAGGSEEEWLLYYSESSTAPADNLYSGEGVVTGIDETSYTLEGLDPNTTYYVYVRAKCGENDYSDWTAAESFTTLCAAETLPYSYDFEDADELNCWTIRGAHANTGIVEGGNNSSAHSFQFYYGLGSGPQYLISPEFSATSLGIHVQLYHKQTNAGATLQIGYSTTDNATASFTWEEGTPNQVFSSFTSYEYNCPPGTKYVAIRYSATTYTPILIDDITFTNAYDKVSNGSQGYAYWNNDSDWYPVNVPSSTDNVYINHNMTIPNDCTAEVNSITFGPSGSLTIADGGQLICNNAVEATVEKNISAWPNTTPADGWYFIASPINRNDLAPTDVNHMITDNIPNDDESTPRTYDLYGYDATASKPWVNYRGHSNNFVLANGHGYLYANIAPQTLQFSGYIQPSNENVTVGSLKEGYNLVGNPYTCNAYINQNYYMLVDGSAVSPTVTNKATPIAPCTGVVVESTAGGSVKFSKIYPVASANNGNLQMVLAQNVATRGEGTVQTLDKAIVSFNEDSQLGKFYFGTQDANLYIPQNNEEYAIVSSNAQGEMPVNFKAHRDGQYTLTVNPEEVEMGYLHLIDNIAGTDVDLLANPSYTFNARNDDYESRFRLVFSANMVNADLNDDFAFFSNGQLVIANEGEAVLQVIDVTGRVVATESVNGTCSKAINAKAGVYVLRLINGTDVKTQKIIVK